MATKRKKRKMKLKKQVKFELFGLIFIAIAIFGSGAALISDGFVPKSLEYLYRLFFGIWFFSISIFLFITGIKLMIHRRFPNFFTKKMIGFYISFAGLLLFTHIQTYESLLLDEKISILGSTWDHFLSYVQGHGTGSQTGGGLIGALLFTFSRFLFSTIGSIIISILTILIGIIFMTEFSIGDFTSKILTRCKDIFAHLKDKYTNNRQERKRIKTEQEEQQASIIETEETNDTAPENPIIQDFTDAVKPNKEAPAHSNSETDDTKSDKDSIDESTHPLPLTENENHAYKLPSIQLLDMPKNNSQQQEHSQIQATARKLENTFKSFGVKASVTKVHVGPAVTKYEVYPEAGVKVSRIVNLHDDIALALAAKDIRIEAPIPGKSAVGIEVPNQNVAMVSIREVLNTAQNSESKLGFALGRDISGEAVVGQLNKMPHMLIAGATGSGKSVCVNGIIISILMQAKPHEVKMMMIDPKKVELNVYNGIPHLLAPVVTDPKKASQALKKVVAEMERRYELFSDTGQRNIEGYNEYIKRHNQENDDDQPSLPYIVVLVDELADLMMVASNEVEDAITRLAQMARAAGIHLIIATQRPSVDVITGVIKANIPSRIAFSVSSQTDS